MQRDIVIVGAGPAGTSAALWCIKRGLSSILIDKSDFPREKLCGGLVTNKGYQELDKLGIDISDISHKPKQIRLYDEEQLILDYSTNANVFIVDRAQFDKHLVDHYIELGGEIRLKTRVTDVSLEHKYVSDNTGNKYYYKHLIVADGCDSRIRKILGEEKLQKALCLETFEENNLKEYSDMLKVVFMKNIKGYAWSFSGATKNAVGIGGHLSSEQMRERLRNMLKNKLDIKFNGAYVPYGKQPKHSKIPGVYFIGDAGGYVNALLGEGISYGIASGRSVVSQIYNSDDNIDKTIRKNLLFFYSMHRMFFNPMINSWALKMICKHKNTAKRITDELILNGAIDYYGFKKLFEIILRG